jgi:diguanylate cyclase (GGDEF)-like protein
MGDSDAIRILAVDDTPASLTLIQRHLTSAGYEVLTARNGNEALQVLRDIGPQLLITDWRMPEMDGIELCRAIRESEEFGYVYIILVTAYTDGECLATAFGAGADDFIAKPFQHRELLARVRAGVRIVDLQKDVQRRSREAHRANAELAITAEELESANHKLSEMATTDDLTGLMNRRAVIERFHEHWSIAARHGQSFSVMMIDIDHFKQVNDTLGHDAGDRVLLETAHALRRSSRSGETVARFGGEEFIVLCPNSEAYQAAVGAERLRQEIEGNVVTVGDKTCRVTISLGVAASQGQTDAPDALLKRADRALYQAKHAGRNRVCVDRAESVLPPVASSADVLAPAPPDLSARGAQDSDSLASTVVLVVDPDEPSRMNCLQGLQTAGYRVLAAVSSEDALAATRSVRTDILVVRGQLARTGNLAWVRQIQKEALPRTVSIVLSGVGEEDEALPEEQLLQGKSTGGSQLAQLIPILRDTYATWDLPRLNLEVHGEQARAMSVLLDFSRMLICARHLEQILEQTVSAAAELTCCTRVLVLSPDRSGRNLTVTASLGVDLDHLKNIAIPIRQSSARRFLESFERFIINSNRTAAEMPYTLPKEIQGEAPMLGVALHSADEPVGVLHLGQRYDHRPFSPFDLECVDLLCNLAATAIQDHQARTARDASQHSIVVALATLAEYRDDDTGRHLERVTKYCTMLAEELRARTTYSTQINEVLLSHLERAVPLHDIGKVAIPDRILLKPGRLTPEEMDVMRRHAEIGAQTIRSVIERSSSPAEFLIVAEQIALCHHEWYNGQGYPRGLKENDIPLVARIVALADVYDALTTQRVYKKAIPHDKTLTIINELCGTQFDPVIVEAFNRREREFANLALQLADPSPHTRSLLTPNAGAAAEGEKAGTLVATPA